MPNAQDTLVALLIAASAGYLLLVLWRWLRSPGRGCGDQACSGTKPDAPYSPRIRELVQLGVETSRPQAANGDTACPKPLEPRSSPAPAAASAWPPPGDSPARK